MSTEALRVVLADDHPGYRRGVAAIVADAPNLALVAEAGDGHEAVDVVLSQRPHVVVMDLNMPGLSGIEATRRIAAEAPEVGVLVLSMIDDDDSVFAALRAGAHGYLLKEAEADEIVHGIVAVHRREAIFGAGIATRVLNYFAHPPRAVTVFPELTARESEILELIAQGLENPEIERRLVVSSKTVRNNVSSIYAKLRVAGRSEAIVRAREAGFGGASPSGQP